MLEYNKLRIDRVAALRADKIKKRIMNCSLRKGQATSTMETTLTGAINPACHRST